MKAFSFAVIAGLVLAGLSCKSPGGQSPMDEKVNSLMAQMTVEEKIGQLNLPGAGDIVTGQAGNSNIAEKIKAGSVGGLFNIKTAEKIREVQRIAVEESRLKIPLLFGMDVIHGYKTVFPIPLALSSSWNMANIEQVARISAVEASADGICWTFSPMVDISRDPRWGRVAEGGGEDPYLGGEIARAMVRGYQGSDLTDSTTIMACVKHFALYGAAEAGRDYNTTDMSRQTMYNAYFPPYKAAIDAGVGTVMSSFNDVDGLPASGNRWLMTEVLRNQWGFGGFVVTDYTAIDEMVDHGVGDFQAVAAMALKAGIDMDMVGEGFLTTIKQSLDEGKVSMEQIDAACRRILEAKFKLGLFDDPYRYCSPERVKKEVFSAEHRNKAREIAGETLVLLKNDGQLLPLKKEGKIALIGPLANNIENMPGTWSVAGDFEKSISIMEGIKAVAGDKATVRYAKGANVLSDAAYEQRVSVFGKPTQRDERSPEAMRKEAVALARQSDVVVAVLGEASEMSGECSSRSDIGIPENQQALLKDLLATGKPVVVVLLTGRPLTLTWENEVAPAILNAWFAGSEAGYAIGDVLFGDVNPSGKLTMTFPKNVGQIPIYYNHKNTGRPLAEGAWFQKFRSNYLDVDNAPLYPFGYGLSYTQFDYSAPSLSKAKALGNDSVMVTVTVTNTGKYAGKEVVQLYLRDVVCSITRPVKELKAFKKVLLQPGESTDVSFAISTDMLSFYNYDLKYDWEPGQFEAMIGTNSRDAQKVSFVWEKE